MNKLKLSIVLVFGICPVSAQDTLRISGDTVVCAGDYHEYTVEGVDTCEWQALNGQVFQARGNVAIVVWDKTKDSLELRAVADGDREARLRVYNKVLLQPMRDFTSITGPSLVQMNSFSEYVLADSALEVTWRITPDMAGSIVSGQGSSRIRVMWHELANMDSMAVTIRALSMSCNFYGKYFKGLQLRRDRPRFAIKDSVRCGEAVLLPEINVDTMVCEGSPAAFGATVNKEEWTDWQWSFDDMTFSRLEKGWKLHGEIAMVYGMKWTGIHKSGCYSDRQSYLMIYENNYQIAYDIGESQLFPRGQEKELKAMVDTPYGSFVPYKLRWSTGEEGNTIKVKKTGNYWVELTDAYGCRRRDVMINVAAAFPD